MLVRLRMFLSRALSAARGGRQDDTDFREELQNHIEILTQENLDHGMCAAEAQRQARIALGGVTQLRETQRATRGFPWIESIGQDLRYAFRMLLHSPGFTLIAVLSLALGIGANTAIFSLINSVMLRMLPVERPQELVQVQRMEPGRTPGGSLTNALWEAFRDQQDVFSSTFAWSNWEFDLAQGGTSRHVAGLVASGDYFDSLGITPALGRVFGQADDHRGCPQIAVLNYPFWKSHYAAAESAVGSTLMLNGQPFQVIGVNEPGFYGMEVGKTYDVAIPLCSSIVFDKRNIESRSRWWLTAAGRVKNGITPEQLAARLKLLSPAIAAAAAPDWKGDDQQSFRKSIFAPTPAWNGTSDWGLRKRFAGPLNILMTIVAMVLLIACANIAGLLLARATGRGREIAIRAALGASRGRLLRQLLTESMLLSLLGAGFGLLFARWCSELLAKSISTGRNPIHLDLSLDGRVLGFTAAATVITGIMMGLLPALRSTRVELTHAMKGCQPGVGEMHARSGASKWIVGSQVALSLVLLISGGLLLRTFLKLLTSDMGFDRSSVLVVMAKTPWFAADTAKLTVDQRTRVNREIAERLRVLPGVTAVAQAFVTPFDDDNYWENIQSDLPNTPANESSSFNFVGPGYLATIGTPLLAGRDFNENDTKNSQSVVIINETVARSYFPGVNPLGRTLVWGEKKISAMVVGIMKDSKYESLRAKTPNAVFLPAPQAPDRNSAANEFVLRTAVPTASLIPTIQRLVHDVNKDLPLEFHTLTQQVQDNLVQERLMAMLSGFFGALAVMLAMIGLYGVLSYGVGQRQAEFGIRMALGAKPESILRLVMREVVLVLIGGIAAGVAISLATVKLLQQMLYGLQARDLTTMMMAIGLLSIMALLAGYLPARRATRVDPMVALRYE